MTASTQSPGEGELIARLRAYAESNPDTGRNGELRVGPMMLRGACSSAADTIQRLSERLARMEEERGGHTDAFNGVVCAKIEAERRLEEMRTNHDGALRLYSQWRSRAEKAEAELARLSRQDPKEEG